MAVAQTGAIFKTLEFDGENSGNYGVYISGEAVFNAPERDVEMITIPNRNGSFALDNGRFENIEVTYPAGIFADNEMDFSQAISDFRNFLCSRKGYCRLADGYNPDEYRMAIYKSGLEVTPAQLKAGEFEITFECKPQRYLMSGESAVEVSDGDTLFNPTKFDSSPLLEVFGYGDVYINNEKISIDNGPIGEVFIGDTLPAKFNIDAFNSGDYIFYKGHVNYNYGYALGYRGNSNSGYQLYNGAYFLVGTAASNTLSLVKTGEVWDVNNPSVTYSFTVTFTTTISYDGADLIYDNSSFTVSGDGAAFINMTYDSRMEYIVGDSTAPSLGNPIYVDLEVGEAYKVENGTEISVNNAVSIPLRLPMLFSGANNIAFDNTISKLNIIPKWWKV